MAGDLPELVAGVLSDLRDRSRVGIGAGRVGIGIGVGVRGEVP